MGSRLKHRMSGMEHSSVDTGVLRASAGLLRKEQDVGRSVGGWKEEG